jgi:hypothetical protein
MTLKGQYSDEGIMYSQEALAFLFLLSSIHLSSLEHKRLQLPVAKRFQYRGGKLYIL